MLTRSGSPGQTSPDHTGHVLIRSTRVHPSDQRLETGTRPGPGPGPVQITIQKLRQKPSKAPPPRAAGSSQSGRDVVTSRFGAGSRGLGLAALKHQCHSAPLRREVNVQLLGSQDALRGAGPFSGCLGDATVIESQPLMTGHAPVTSDLTASDQTPGLQVTHLDSTAGLLKAASIAVDTGPVATATPHHDQWTETSRHQYLRGASIISTVTQQPAGSHLLSWTNHSEGPARRANETLREMGRLKTEMKMLLTPEDSLKTTTPGPDHHQSQQNLFQSQQSQSQQSKSHQSKSQSQQTQSQSQQTKTQSKQTKSQQTQSQSQQTKSQQTQSQSQQTKTQSQQTKSQQTQSQQTKTQSQQTKSQQTQSQPQQTQSQSQQTQPQSQQTKTQSQQTKSQQTKSQQSQSQSHQSPFQSIQSQHCQTRSQQFQSVLVQRKPVVPSTLEEAGLVLRQVRRQKKVLEENLEALLRARTGEVLHCQLDALAANRDWTEEVRIKKTVDAWISTSTRDIQAEMSSEEAAMTSQQRPAGSSAHTGRGRPVSEFRGTGSERGSRGPLQGAEPEAYLNRLYGRAPYEGVRRTLKKSPYLRFSSPVSLLGRKPRPRLVESVTGVKVKSCKTQTSPGRRHDIIGSSHLTSGDFTVTVPMAIPLGRPRMDSSSSRCLAERQQEVTSPPAAPPTCSVVAVDNGESESQEVEQLDALPPPPLLPPVDIIESKSDEEEDVFPGTEFLLVADIIQEELRFKGEEEVQLDGGPSPPPVPYQGPVFPPQTRSALPPQDQGFVLNLDLQRDVLENRLVEWVEQQLMSRMISEMYRPLPSDPAQNDSTDQSESKEQSASDIVEAAGGGGLQLFVDSNMSVDSTLIRQLVGEVLTEQVALLLGQRDSLEPEPGLEPAEPGPGSLEEDKLVPLVPTPVPTTPPSRETPPLVTPPPSEPTSLLNDESPRPITAPEHVATPPSSPEPAPSAGSPLAVHQAPPPLTWGDVELPLDEERPEEYLDTRSQLLVMSVAEEEPFLSSPLPPSSTPPAPSPSPPPPPGPGPRPESPSSSSEESSSTVTAETEAVLRHISEGELLLSVNQLAAMTDEAVPSFSSSLQELHEMDFDPPSEGQVKGLDLLKTKTEQRDTQPEGPWRMDQDQEEVSVGEVRGTRTAQQDQTWSPGQMSQCADVTEVSFEATNQSSVAVGDLMTEPIGTLTSDLQTDRSLTPPPHLEDTHTTGRQPISREDS
ncbi:protein TALPID3 isoform X3 [Cebidichthys violaceus]|uniref:protein TALPID3 isoform X3 n=1 Tax=Cebidichthys violaceus TaxID=271503 RepID=UPI0035CC2AF0